ncbi:6-bladed beta-propeller [Rhodohalobacter halophilus]|uniref:6-bladed beta-propeller n=1 Tax=Rhodohalobacter halophilus TaxID=1812810 RepID=UPI00083F9136|nr:6-bladed beta-propeller [Rhodohalobacter halophilus]
MKILKVILAGLSVIISMFLVINLYVSTDLVKSNYQEEKEGVVPTGKIVTSKGYPLEFKKQWEVTSDNLANPYSLYKFHDYLIVQDNSSQKPLPVFKVDGVFSHFIGSWGKGPGEFSRDGHTVIGIQNEQILIYDRETSRILSFNISDGHFVNEKSVSLKTFPYLHGNKLISRAAVPFDHFAYGVSLLSDLSTDTDTTVYGYYQELKKLLPAKNNHLLKQGDVATDSNSNAFIALNNSSLIIGFDVDGNVIFMNEEPVNMGALPDLTKIDLPASLRGGLISPPLNMFPKHYVSVGVNDDYIIGVYSGFQINNRQDFLDADRANEGSILHIFDKKTSSYLESVDLDVPLRSLVLDGNDVYAISVSPEIKLKKFKL